ncbi:hypothetical protein P4E94_10080 [Pontiellaceae bacterium B12219]|nr:hypothetical protein [Pontiellaceae bacterium B12219]
MTKFRKASTLCLLLTLPLASSALQRTDLLPPQGQTYVQISNTTDFWAKLKQSSVGKFWMDQQFQDFLGNPDAETWNSFFFNGDSTEEDEVFVEQMKMLTGELILSIDSKTEDLYIIADMSEADFKRGLELDEQLRKVAEDPFDVIRSSFQDVEIIQHINNPGSEDETLSWQAHVGRTFIMGYSREWVEQSIVRLKKEPVTEPAGNPTMNLNIPVKTLLLDSLDGPNDEDRALFDALGLLGIETFSSHIELFDTEMVMDNNLIITDLQRGLFALLDTDPSDLPTVTFIPENISSLEVGRFDLLGLWKEIPDILSGTNPQAKPQFDMMLAMIQQQAGVNFEQDLLSHLGTQYLAFATPRDNVQSSVIALELKDGIAFRQGLESLLTAPSMAPYVASALEISDFLDYSIYTLKQSTAEEAMGVAVTDNYLLYGDPEGLRQVIRSVASEAAANMAFEQTELVQGLRKHIKPDAFGFSAVDWTKNMDSIVAELNKPEYITMVQQYWAKSGSALPPPDFSKLPSADHIASFFNTSYQYIEASRSGLHQKVILKY